MAIDPVSELSELSAKLASIAAVLDPDAMRKESEELRVRAADPGLWSDQEQAQAVTRRLSYLEGEIARLDGLERRLEDTRVMFELAASENDEPTRQEALGDLAALRKEIDQLEIRTLLNGEYDAREALISINAQAGGADAADWAEGLGRIYLRWAARVPDRDLGHLLRGGGRDQVVHVRDQGAIRLRDAARRARHAPDGAHLQVRQPGPPSDLVRRRGRDAGGGAGRSHRHPRG